MPQRAGYTCPKCEGPLMPQDGVWVCPNPECLDLELMHLQIPRPDDVDDDG